MIQPPDGYAELLARPQWVNAETTKIPYTPSLEGEMVPAKAGDGTTWGLSATALAAQASGRFPYVGYEIDEADPYFLVDLDGQRNPETGAPTPLAAAVIALLRTLTESSVRGGGFHLIARGTLPNGLIADGKLGKKVGPCEIYFGKHYGITTFRPLKHFTQIRDVDEATIRILFRLLFPAETKVAQPAAPQVITPTDWDDTALLEHAFAAKNGEDFRRQHNGLYLDSDESADDFGYLGHLYFWCQGDPHRMRRIALASARVRDKWATRRGDSDWLDYSIANLCKKGGQVYQGIYPFRSTGDAEGQVGQECGRCAALAADVQRLGDQLRARDAENARLVAENAELRSENHLLHETRKHTDQTVGGAIWDAARALKKRYAKGLVQTQDGEDLAPVIAQHDATDRSSATLGRCIATIEAAGKVTVKRLPKTIKTESGKDKVIEIAHLFIPPEHRHSEAAIVRYMLPPGPEKKKQGGSKPRIAVPRSEEHPAAPLIRRHETIETFRSMAAPSVVLGQPTLVAASETYFTNDGEQITQHRAHQIQVELGYETPPWFTPTIKPYRNQSDYPLKYEDRIQDDFGTASEPAPEPLHGYCRYCRKPRLGPTEPYCADHAPGGAAYSDVVAQPGFGYAAGDD